MDIQTDPVTLSKIPEGFRVAIKGSVHTNLSWLDSELDRIVAARPKLVELDLSEMPHVSSVGLGSFVLLRKRIVENGGELRVVAIQKNVLGVFRFSYLDKVFQIDPAVVVANKR